MHPRLTVVPVDRAELGPTRAVLGSWARIVDPDAFDAAVVRAGDERRERERGELERLEVELEELGRRQAEHESALHELIQRQREMLASADWCLAQPALEGRERVEIDESGPVLEEHRRQAREANHRLERVLEQRAAAETALEEARAELDDLGAVTFDETGLRRQLEEASRTLTVAASAHREALNELESCRSEVHRLESELAPDAESAGYAEQDQFRAMHASIRARLRGGPDPSVDELGAARARVERLETNVQEASTRMSALRQRVQALETELAARSRDGHSLGARQDAAEQLEQQVRAVEERLGEAEQRARVDADEATRALSRAELGVERLHAAAAERRRRLRSLVHVLPVESREDATTDPLAVAERIGEALRAAADDQQAAIERAAADAEALRHELTRRRDEHREREERLHEIQPEDRLVAVDRVVSAEGPVVVDLLHEDGGSPFTLGDLATAEFPNPVVVLTDDPDVLAWAIGVPAERGAVVPVHALLEPSSVTDTSSPNPDMEHHTS